MGKFRLVSRWFFVFVLFLCAVSADFFGDLPNGLRRRCIFLGIFSLGNGVKFLYFVQWLSLPFVFCQFTYYYYCYLYCYYYYHYYYYFSWRKLYTSVFADVSYCKFELTWNKELHYITLRIDQKSGNQKYPRLSFAQYLETGVRYRYQIWHKWL